MATDHPDYSGFRDDQIAVGSNEGIAAATSKSPNRMAMGSR